MHFQSEGFIAVCDFRILLNGQFWVKLFVIVWWSIVIGTYLWFLSFVPKTPLLDSWFSVVVSTLLGGAGMNHITNLYKVPIKDFHLGFAWPAFFMSVGAIALVCGVFLGALHKETWAQVVSTVYILVAVFVMVWGADTAPAPWRNRNA